RASALALHRIRDTRMIPHDGNMIECLHRANDRGRVQREVDMTRILAAAAMVLLAASAQAQDKLKIGVIATLSGPPAVLGQQLRNGFNLAVKTLDGKLGGGRDEGGGVADQR